MINHTKNETPQNIDVKCGAKNVVFGKLFLSEEMPPPLWIVEF